MCACSQAEVGALDPVIWRALVKVSESVVGLISGAGVCMRVCVLYIISLVCVRTHALGCMCIVFSFWGQHCRCVSFTF